MFPYNPFPLFVKFTSGFLRNCVFIQLLICIFSSISSRHNPQLLTGHPVQQCLHPVLPNIPSVSFCHSLKLSLQKLCYLGIYVRKKEEQEQLEIMCMCGGQQQGSPLQLYSEKQPLPDQAVLWQLSSLLTFHWENLVAKSKC